MDRLMTQLPPERLSYILELAQLIVFGAAALAIVVAILFGRGAVMAMPTPARNAAGA